MNICNVIPVTLKSHSIKTLGFSVTQKKLCTATTFNFHYCLNRLNYNYPESYHQRIGNSRRAKGRVFLLGNLCVRRFIKTGENKMGKSALVIIANGSEEIEAVTPIDTLRRAGVEVTVAGLEGAGNTILSRNVIVGAEKSLKDALAAAPFDAVILPGGGKGSQAFVESAEVGELLRDQEKGGRLIAAICAAPTALHKHDICVGRSVTSYPAMKDKMMEGGKYQYKEDRVVIDGNLITSRGPGTSLEFSLALAAYLVGQEKADEVGKAMLFQSMLEKRIKG